MDKNKDVEINNIYALDDPPFNSNNVKEVLYEDALKIIGMKSVHNCFRTLHKLLI